MRTTLLTGLALVLGGVVVILLGSSLDLELESTALMGAALGAVVALVPDRTPVVRIVSFLGGLVIAWVGYFVRAGLLPDTSTGRAAALVVVVVLCVALVAASLNRLPLWAVLLGAAAMAGGYEASYAVAPSEVLDTSISAVTTIVLTVAAGFLAAALVSPTTATAPATGMRASRDAARAPRDRDSKLDDLMETAR